MNNIDQRYIKEEATLLVIRHLEKVNTIIIKHVNEKKLYDSNMIS